MTTFSWYGYTVAVDEQATKDYYAKAPDWDCPCGHCRNFLALAKARKLPPEILEILDQLHIPPEKTTDLSEFCDEDGKLRCGLRCRVTGWVLDETIGGPKKE